MVSLDPVVGVSNRVHMFLGFRFAFDASRLRQSDPAGQLSSDRFD